MPLIKIGILLVVKCYWGANDCEITTMYKISCPVECGCLVQETLIVLKAIAVPRWPTTS